MRIELNLLGEKQINRRLERYAFFAGNLIPAFEEVHEYLLGVEDRQFASEGGASGSVWAPLAASTARAKARRNLDPRVLHATLDMRNSLTEESDPAHVKYITPSMMVFGTTDKKAIIHQKGTDRMPRRRPIDLTEFQKVTIIKIIQAYISGGELSGTLRRVRGAR